MWVCSVRSGHLAGPGRLHDQPHANSKPGQHVDQSVRAEQIDATAEEIADSRLGDPQHLGDLGLFEPAGGDGLLQVNEEVRPDQEVLGLGLRKAEVTKDVPRRSGRRC